jgi:hypothetical protein
VLVGLSVCAVLSVGLFAGPHKRITE